MRHIQKSAPPEELISWVKGHADGTTPEFDGPGFPKQAVRLSLLSEQGFICAYTMIPLRPRTDDRAAEVCHLEHLVPQSDSKERGQLEETVEYRNLLACYPGTSGEQNPGFGATKKGDEQITLTPLVSTCEKRITFRLDGSAKPTMTTDAEAERTIEVLSLDCERLRQNRLAAFREFGLGLDSESALSLAETTRLAKTVRNLRADGTFYGYCLAVAGAAEEFAVLLTRASTKRKHVRAAQKRGRK